MTNVPLKYLHYYSQTDGAKLLIFSNELEHSAVFRDLRISYVSILGAGYVDLESMECVGSSVSIDCQSTKACTALLRKMFQYEQD